ncbi:MAG: response regulator transcription factor [Bacteriovoracaceae bacterium]|nr:response regulator transcription factor [Bacteriovoracaceae bacterium]
MSKILVLEDDKNLGESLIGFLKGEGHEVTHCQNIKEAEEAFSASKENKTPFELMVLDWMLPDGQGIDFLSNVRRTEKSTPIIMLTARTELIDKVIGLESGANDYMTKPFEPRELVARIRVQLRTKGQQKVDTKEKITLGELEIDDIQREVTYHGVKKEFTKMEYDFLKLLAESPNRAFSREEILNKVWGYENYPSTRTVDTHVLQIRQKLTDELIETVRGIGYRLRFDEN